MKIWLDPDPVVPHGWIHARDLADMERLFTKGPVHSISMCYDLKLMKKNGEEITGLDVAKWMYMNRKWPSYMINVHERLLPSTHYEIFEKTKDLFKYFQTHGPLKPDQIPRNEAFGMAEEGMPLKQRLLWIKNIFKEAGSIALRYDAPALGWETNQAAILKATDEKVYRCAGINSGVTHLLIYRQMKFDDNLYYVSFKDFYRAMTGSYPFEWSEPDTNPRDFSIDTRVENVLEMLSTINDWTWFSNPIPADNFSSELHFLAREHLQRLPNWSGKENIGIEIRARDIKNYFTVSDDQYYGAHLRETRRSFLTPLHKDIQNCISAMNAFFKVFHLISTTGHKFYSLEDVVGKTPMNGLLRPKVDHIAEIFASHAAHLITFDTNSPWDPLIDIWAMGYYPDKVDANTGNYVICRLGVEL